MLLLRLVLCSLLLDLISQRVVLPLRFVSGSFVECGNDFVVVFWTEVRLFILLLGLSVLVAFLLRPPDLLQNKLLILLLVC